MARAKRRASGSRAMDLLPAAMMGMSGGSKFASGQSAQMMAQWGYPPGWEWVTGAMELTGAALLAFPRSREAGAVVSGAVLAGAFATHMQHREYRIALLPLLTGAVVAQAVWRRRRAQRAAVARRPSAEEPAFEGIQGRASMGSGPPPGLSPGAPAGRTSAHR